MRCLWKRQNDPKAVVQFVNWLPETGEDEVLFCFLVYVGLLDNLNFHLAELWTACL